MRKNKYGGADPRTAGLTALRPVLGSSGSCTRQERRAPPRFTRHHRRHPVTRSSPGYVESE
eukprot:5617620-Prymnesium_polylepis.1